MSENQEYVLRIKDLDIQYYTDAGLVYANNKINLNLKPKERLGIVGESGSGKSTLALGILRMIKPPGRIAGGEIWLDEVNLPTLSEEEMRQNRGNEVSMVPQGAMNSLNPVMRIQDQIIDAMQDHDLGLSRQVMEEMAIEALRAVELDPKVGKMYPHELSGGMKQRACVAISVAMGPKVIIADEPTSALDVITQRQVMQTLGRLQERLGSAIILIGHDMGLMAQFVDRIAVMYACQLMELGTVQDIFTNPLNPYTQLLISSLPVLGNRGEFSGIPGITPPLTDLPPGCVFNDRCPKVMDVCKTSMPPLMAHRPNHLAACYLYDEQNAPETERIHVEAVRTA